VDFDAAVAELATLVETLEREGDERALLLLKLVDAIHRPALERIAAGDLDDPLAQTLLAMYDLADVDDEILAEEALDSVRPYIESHGGHVELLDVDGGDVHLQLGGACNGCAGSAMTLTRGIEEALRAHLPGFERVVAHSPPESPQLLQIEHLKRPVFIAAGGVDDVPPGTTATIEIDGIDVLLANVDGELYAVRDACPVDDRSLGGGRLTGTILVCPWHNCAYDVRSGKRADDKPGAPSLAVIPIAVQDGELKVAVNVA
jgi:Fe-S cluster biogenesis protein NfuA/nitrite reductase/ring-hydroxylating ferredoxin subunit